MGHLKVKVCDMWRTAEFDDLVGQLIMDSRDGTRQGLPPDVAADLLFLAETNKIVRAMDLAERTGMKVSEAYLKIEQGDLTRRGGDAMSDPLAARDAVDRSAKSVMVARPKPVSDVRPTTARPRPAQGSIRLEDEEHAPSLLYRIATSKWLIAAIIGALVLKAAWPQVRGMLGLG